MSLKRSYSKYRAVKTEVDGIRFDSKKEAARYCELRLLEKAGQIRQLRTQLPLDLTAGTPRLIRLGAYVADFVYEERVGDDWIIRFEDVKGFKTPLYRWKKKHVEAQYGIQIREV